MTDDHDAAADMLKSLVSTWPAWMNAGGLADTARYRQIIAAAHKLRSKRRNGQWLICANAVLRDFELLRAGIYERTGV